MAIFILPPSREELERRLRSRGQDPAEEIARRLAKAREEIAASEDFYDFCVVNDEWNVPATKLRRLSWRFVAAVPSVEAV